MKMWYNVFATQISYFFRQKGKYFGKKCFLSFLIPFVGFGICVAAIRGMHFFGAWLRLRTFLIFAEEETE